MVGGAKGGSVGLRRMFTALTLCAGFVALTPCLARAPERGGASAAAEVETSGAQAGVAAAAPLFPVSPFAPAAPEEPVGEPVPATRGSPGGASRPPARGALAPGTDAVASGRPHVVGPGPDGPSVDRPSVDRPSVDRPSVGVPSLVGPGVVGPGPGRSHLGGLDLARPPEAGAVTAGAGGTLDPYAGVPHAGTSRPGAPGEGASTPGASTPGASTPGPGAAGASTAGAANAGDPPAAPVEVALNTSNGTTELDGVLLLPPGIGPFPAVVLVADPSADAMDASLPDARLFVQAGVAAYVFERRPAAVDAGWRGAPRVDDLVGDTVAAVEAVRRAGGVDPERVGVWGVGEGGWILPFVGARADLAFLILVDAAAVPLPQQQMWRTGNALAASGAPAPAVGAAVRGMQLAYSVRPIVARVVPRERLGPLADDPGLAPATALAGSHAPMLAVFGTGDAAPVVASAAALRAAVRDRDEPLDVVTVLDAHPHDLTGSGRATDPAYRQTVLGWVRTVVSGGPPEALAPEAVRGMTRGFAPLGVEAAAGAGAAGAGAASPGPGGAGAPGTGPAGAGPAGAGPAGVGGVGGSALGGSGGPGEAAAGAAGTIPAPALRGRWFAGSEHGTPWYAGAWLQIPALIAFLLAFALGLIVSLVPARAAGRTAGTEGFSATAHRARNVRATAARGGTAAAARRHVPPARTGTGAALRTLQGLVSLVDLALLAALSLTVLELLGLVQAPPLAARAVRPLSAASGTVALALAWQVLFLPRTGWRAGRTGVAVGVAVAAALFLPYLVYWQAPFLRG